MKMNLRCHLVLSLAIFVAAGTAAEKVILDSDMVLLFDDGVAMMLLAEHPNVEVLGVTIVPGNTWLAEGMAHGIAQLEALDRADIPLVRGVRYPLRAGRYEMLELERRMFGFSSSYVGCFARKEPAS